MLLWRILQWKNLYLKQIKFDCFKKDKLANTLMTLVDVELDLHVCNVGLRIRSTVSYVEFVSKKFDFSNVILPNRVFLELVLLTI